MYSLFESKHENKNNIRLKGKLIEPFYRRKRAQVNFDYRGSHLSNEFAHDNFSKLDSLLLFLKTTQGTYIFIS